MMRPTVWRGLSEANGSWKIIWMSLRSGRNWLSDNPAISRPLNTSLPPSMPISLSRHLPMVDLPEPDSPTMPSVSPRRTSKLTSSTARTTRFLPNQPWPVT
ncbi:Uncharacterised protein [Bordetella pertussis]|nr:Uncharacterised protein [Bordetella pertussis]